MKWVTMIENHRQEIVKKSEEAFEKAMHDWHGSFHRTFAVVMRKDGDVRIDIYASSEEEAEDVHDGDAISITAYQYDPHWEDEWGDEAQTEEERQDRLQKYIEWYEAEGFIERAVDRCIDSLPMNGYEYIDVFRSGNPSRIEYEGHIYTESDLAGMDSGDYDEVMENGTVIRE